MDQDLVDLCPKFRSTLNLFFIDFEKAFDIVNRKYDITAVLKRIIDIAETLKAIIRTICNSRKLACCV